MKTSRTPPSTRADYTIAQDWESYTDDEHAVWRTLYARQAKLLPGRACDAFLQGLDILHLNADGIPDFARLNRRLHALTGWTVVAVPDLVPDAVFFEHLANRRFPAGRFIRTFEQLDYLQEPDIFHDVFGHVPMLANPVFADYMQLYGRNGLRAVPYHALHFLARLYWYTVEFGLIQTPGGLRIYGSGIVSSFGESTYCLESPSPNRIGFDLQRVMSTAYRIDNYQQTYFVIDSFEQLFAATNVDLVPVYPNLFARETIAPDAVVEGDHVLGRFLVKWNRRVAPGRRHRTGKLESGRPTCPSGQGPDRGPLPRLPASGQ
ncbi:MAG: phenylalanine 4-monooxygenase [Alphaproteobacteria bacterium]|nr:MAG: phenylalanine 4-monooxygenase [Alphaproteobacteria bacterium]